jgi:hypothetical protein
LQDIENLLKKMAAENLHRTSVDLAAIAHSRETEKYQRED